MENKYPLALVTGGAQRLGRAFAFCLAQRGFAVLLHCHTSTEQALASASELRELGVPVYIQSADLTDSVQVEALFATLDTLLTEPDSKLAGLRVLVNSAAVMTSGNLQNLPAAEWDATLALNLRAPFLCAQLAYARMRTGGLIVNISDIGAQKNWSQYPAYTISKAGLEALTRLQARSFAPQVRVNAIAPGLVMPSASTPPDEWERLVSRLPIRRPARPDEITRALEFLLDNEYITGQILRIDGGYSLL